MKISSSSGVHVYSKHHFTSRSAQRHYVEEHGREGALENFTFDWCEMRELMNFCKNGSNKNNPSVDDLVREVFSKYRHDRVKVTTCANTVRVEHDSVENTFVQKTAGESELWKVFREGNYLCGMETLHDAFRVARLMDEL